MSPPPIQVKLYQITKENNQSVLPEPQNPVITPVLDVPPVPTPESPVPPALENSATLIATPENPAAPASQTPAIILTPENLCPTTWNSTCQRRNHSSPWHCEQSMQLSNGKPSCQDSQAMSETMQYSKPTSSI